ncbi:MAG: hypothetical protein GX572_04340 [Clostridia bacterium]|nr:hypothetical protein [Clostridia bacterium]
MKKLLLVMLALALILAFAACGDKQPNNNEGPLVDSDLASAEYAQMMQNGTYYMESTTYVMGMAVNSVTAVDGANSDSRNDFMGANTWTLILDGTLYNIDEATQTYYIVPVGASTEAAATDYGDMSYVGKGNDIIPGFTDIDSGSYDYEEYLVTVASDGGKLEMQLRYYFKDGSLYVIYSNPLGIDSIMQITKISKDIPAGMLSLPEGYTEIAIPSF